MYASPRPLGFAEVVEKLNISKGSASQGLQLLRELGAIMEAAGVNGRGVTYEPELSLRQLVTGVLRERIAPMTRPGAEHMKRLKTIAQESVEHTEFYLGRAKQLETWRKRFTTVLPLLTVLLGPKKTKPK
jgi:HTH-type transcriptional regulator, glycine betaine synthesis regulator